jgi:hypothetical protein
MKKANAVAADMGVETPIPSTTPERRWRRRLVG